MDNTEIPEFLEFQAEESVPLAMVSPINEENKLVSCTWTHANTCVLLDVYKTYRQQVGTLKIKNFKRMWEMISIELKTKYNIQVSPGNCENRWRVLERNYNKYIDNVNKTGAGRKTFEYIEAMSDILGKKKNIHPNVLLSTSTISKPHERENNPEVQLEFSKEPQPGCSKSFDGPPKNRTNVAIKLKNKNNILENMRIDKKNRQEEKLKFEREKFKKYCEFQTQKQESREKRNELLQENNNLLRERNSILIQLYKRGDSMSAFLSEDQS